MNDVSTNEKRFSDPPSFVISRWPGFGVALHAGQAAALRCDVDANPAVRAAWVRDSAPSPAPPLPPPAPEPEPPGAATLRWQLLESAHAGWYRCRATWADTEYSSIGYYLNVLCESPRYSISRSPLSIELVSPHRARSSVTVCRFLRRPLRILII